ncbi:hypothetical protein BS17DRAFT_161244 [Gyrodon lividus]|nr:hypothetical protein BS17DRAFT_161244 [Gyrodon lividus]
MAPTTRNCATVFPSTGELGTDAISDPSLSEDHIEKDLVGSFSPAAQTSRRPFETTPSAACANIEQAAAAAENVPDVRLMPPLEDGTAPQELFTPKTGWPAIRSCSGGSSAGPATPPKKRRNRDKQRAPPDSSLSSYSPSCFCSRLPSLSLPSYWALPSFGRHHSRPYFLLRSFPGHGPCRPKHLGTFMQGAGVHSP